MDRGELWSFCRRLLSQGGDIQLDYNAGKYKRYEEYSARLDAAARERTEELAAICNASAQPYVCPHCGGDKGHWEGCRAPAQPGSLPK